ncbi:unnamed protein product [Absidia cylindrospora]
MKPAINLPCLEEESSSLSMPSSLSSSSILDSPHTFLDSNFTLSKSFDPFDFTYLNNLIPTTTKSTTSATCSIPPSLWTIQNGSLSYSAINGGDMHDQYGEEDYAETDDHYPPHFLIDLDLLDDNAIMMHSEFESPLPSCPAKKCREGAPPVPGSGTITATAMMNHRLLHLPYLFISSSSSSSSSSTSSSSSVTGINIWSNNYYRYLDPFDDDEFDPTQPASPSLSSDISTSPQFTCASPCQQQSTAIGMLMDLLPHYTQQQLTLTLSKANYDMDRFLELVSSCDDDGGVPFISYTKKRQVCRHFLSGDCHRQDCRFAHDISTKVCKFWLQGGCLKGPQCEFAHSLEPICIRSQNDTTTATTQSPKPGTKSTLSKNKNKSKIDKPYMEDLHQCYTLDNNIFTDGNKQRRRGRKKIKRKANTSTNDDTITNNNTRLLPAFVDYPVDDDFPTLLSSLQSPANTPAATGVSPLRVPTPSSTNFAQVVARSKVKK